jgi:hypothetical protein
MTVDEGAEEDGGAREDIARVMTRCTWDQGGGRGDMAGGIYKTEYKRRKGRS